MCKWYYALCWWGQGKSQIILNLFKHSYFWENYSPGIISHSFLPFPTPKLPIVSFRMPSVLFFIVFMIKTHIWAMYFSIKNVDSTIILWNLGQITYISIDFPIWKMKIICLSLRLSGLTYIHVLRKSMSHIWFDEHYLFLCCAI